MGTMDLVLFKRVVDQAEGACEGVLSSGREFRSRRHHARPGKYAWRKKMINSPFACIGRAEPSHAAFDFGPLCLRSLSTVGFTFYYSALSLVSIFLLRSFQFEWPFSRFATGLISKS
jgi:hypothetical protein